MSLTFLGRAIAFLLFALCAAWGGQSFGPPLAQYLAEARSTTMVEDRISDRALVYRLPQDRPLSFAFSQPVSRVKLLVQPAVAATDRAREAGFVYGLRMRLFDGDGAEIAVNETFLQADGPDAVFASGQTWRFFRNRPEMVGEQDHLVIESPLPASRIEVEQVDPDPAILGVDVRLYEQRPFLSAQPLATFRRMSERDRRELSAPNAFPEELLSRAEMEYIAINHWRPIGPQGIEGRDYDALVLYESSRRARKGAPQ